MLASVGMTALGYLHDLNMPKALDDKAVTFTSLTDQLRSHFGVKTTVLAARHEFSHVVQRESQTVDEFAAALRTSSLHCNFGNELDGRHRDQLIVGLRSEAVRKRIMEREDITFADALKLAAVLERITREAKLGSSGETSVSRVRQEAPQAGRWSRGEDARQTCVPNATASGSAGPSRGGSTQIQGGRGAFWSCGALGHRRADCPYARRGRKCHECGEKGHKETVCPKRFKSSGPRNQEPQNSREQSQNVHAAAAEGQLDTDAMDADVATINTIQACISHGVTAHGVAPVPRKKSPKQFRVHLTVNGVPITMALDTGAHTSLAYRRCGGRLENWSCRLRRRFEHTVEQWCRRSDSAKSTFNIGDSKSGCRLSLSNRRENRACSATRGSRLSKPSE